MFNKIRYYFGGLYWITNCFREDAEAKLKDFKKSFPKENFKVGLPYNTNNLKNAIGLGIVGIYGERFGMTYRKRVPMIIKNLPEEDEEEI